jgi:Fe-S-cluster containining protein
MLDNEEKAAFLQSIEQVRQRVTRHLGPAPHAEQVIGFVSSLHASVDKVVQKADERGLSTDCKAGCAYCCSVRVETSPAEVFLIARELRKRPVHQLNSLRHRLKQHVAATDALGGDVVRIDCAFLDTNLCAIYPLRPATCRKAHSVVRECCEKMEPEIPHHLDILLSAEALIKGTGDAYRDCQLDASPLELCRAVLLALSDESAESRWSRGELVFSGDQ